MTTLSFTSKANTLALLHGRLASARVLEPLIFSVSEWSSSPEQVLDSIQGKFNEKYLIVRSSVIGEDSVGGSHAGEFKSVAKVPASKRSELRSAIDEVIASYDSPKDEDQFFVQEQLQDIQMCGVLFTRDLASDAPYYVVNYDEGTGRHEAVTSGTTSELETYIRLRSSPNLPKDSRFASLFACSAELESMFGSDRLDIEFAITRTAQLYILQVRPLTGSGSRSPVADGAFGEFLNRVFHKIKKLNAPHPGLLGKRTAYSVMTDWNPAEMIGIRPRRLALSLYKELITDSIWAYQRDNYGYRNLRSFPLMISFLGCPYIDVRASFNSFVPKEVDDELAGRLVDYYVEHLLAEPSNHDKAEFKIVFSCYYFGITEELKKILPFGFTELELDRLKFALLNLTNRVLSPQSSPLAGDFERIKTLESRFREIAHSELPVLDKIYWLIEDTKRYGTLPFAGLARCGFIAVQLLQSMVRSGILDESDYQRFMVSLKTVSSELAEDSAALSSGSLSRESFLDKYGHLRPGTYDICSRRYDEAFDEYFSTGALAAEHRSKGAFTLSDEKRQRLSRELRANGLQITPEDLFQFLRRAIEGREFAKFVFTRSVSMVLQLIESIGKRFDIDREDLAHTDITTFLRLYSTLTHESLDEILRREIDIHRTQHRVCQLIRLPQTILSEDDIYDFSPPRVEPNYVTLNKVTAIVVCEEEFPNQNLNGSIALIRSADPGYDWIFSRNIAGLVTLYGGANSHMAIRCAELGIPAVIGCGDAMFKRWGAAHTLSLDCENQRVTVIK